MAEVLKANYYKEFLRPFRERVHAVYDAFDMEGFVEATMD